MRVAYSKLGRSMLLVIDKCGFVGGDNEAISVLVELALRHPGDEFVLAGRNSGESPAAAYLPTNITNPWTELGPRFSARVTELRRKYGIDRGGSFPQDMHLELDEWLRENVVGPTCLDDVDAHVMWVGQHGTSNTPIPGTVKEGITKPQDAFTLYCAHLVMGINQWRDERDPLCVEEVILNADPRNFIKARDFKWPYRHPVITQFDYHHFKRCHRYGDKTPPWEGSSWEGDDVWKSRVKCSYERLEVCGVLPGTPVGDMLTYDETFESRAQFGLFINEARGYGIPEEKTRLHAMKHWVLPLEPAFVHGEWTDESQAELKRAIRGKPFSAFDDLYHSVLCTFTTPSSGSGWATTKPWEAFACGTVCFFHPLYDTQDNILGDADPLLLEWLRVESPDDLAAKIKSLQGDRRTWVRLVRLQREHYLRASSERRYLAAIEKRVWGQPSAESYQVVRPTARPPKQGSLFG